MTTPGERRRNLIWQWEALEELLADATLIQHWRDESAELLGRYPSVAAIKGSSDPGLEPLQIQYAQVLPASKDLFQRMRASTACSEQRRYSLLAILRHFY